MTQPPCSSIGTNGRQGALLLSAVFVMGCAGAQERAVQQEFAEHDSPETHTNSSKKTELATDSIRNERPEALSADQEPKQAGSLAWYLARALEESPEVRASFQRWRASVHRIAQTRRLPDPTISFSYFIRSVETRVGPQQARVGLQQAFPWPTELSAGADAAAERARAAQRAFDTRSLVILEGVARAYWALWRIRRTRAIHREHLQVIHGLSETTRARLATGQVDLAEQQQVDLTAAREEDVVRGLDEEERAAAARLRAAVGLPFDQKVPTTDEAPVPALPKRSLSELSEDVRSHPMLEIYEHRALAQESTARAEAAARWPSFTLGADWIVIGDSPVTPAPTDNGKDAVSVGAGISVPLWQGNYRHSIEAARAEAEAFRLEKDSATDRALAELSEALARVRDAVRRVALYRDALLPQAESTYASVLGSYTVGRGTVAQTLLAQRDLLELRVELAVARANYAQSWARLEEVTGRRLERSASGVKSDRDGEAAVDSGSDSDSDSDSPNGASRDQESSP